MEIKPFLVEEWMNQYEVGARYNIAETCVDSVSLDELFQLTGEDKEAFLSSLCARRLTYGDIFGQPAFLEGICRLYRDLRPEQVIPTHGAAGANHHLFCSLVEPGDKVISVLPTYQQLYSIPDSLGAQVELLPLSPDNGFLPDLARLEELAQEGVKLICLNNPNNPTGAVATREQLKVWVDYANANGAVILYDSAYEAFITEEDVPHTIFEIEGARTCAIEFRSYSKTAGFTGNRCAYTVVPMELKRDGASLNALWNRRQCTKFNGVPYVIQRGAAAIYTPEGKDQTRASIDYYRQNAQVIREGLTAAGLSCFGGVNAPYIWIKTPDGMGSWDFFDLLLDRANVATTPGAGFGPSGEGYIRLTAFGGAEATREAVERVKAAL